MRAAFVVFAKEFLENLRDRRTVLGALVFGPLLGPLLFGFMLQFSIDRGTREFDQDVRVAVIRQDAAPHLASWLSSRGVSLRDFDGDAAAARTAVEERKAIMVLEVPADAGRRLEAGEPVALSLYVDSSNNEHQRLVRRLHQLISIYSQGIATQRLTLRGVDPLLLAPITVQDVDVSTPAARAAILLGMLSFFLILALMTGGLYLAIDTTVGERERGTLEPLLATATTRESLLMGKLMATASYMALSLVLTTTSFFVVMSRVDLESIGMSANLGPLTALQVIGVIATLIPAAAALMTLVAAYARSVREAQAWLSILQLVPTLPLVFASVLNLAPRLELMWVPSLSQHFLMTRLLRAERIEPLELAISVGSTLLLGVVLVWVASRIYRREKLLG